MDENYFVKTVMDMLHSHRENLGLSREMEDWEEEMFSKEVLPMAFKEGWTIQDAYQFNKLTEHVNPNLNETYACKRMKEYALKYAG